MEQGPQINRELGYIEFSEGLAGKVEEVQRRLETQYGYQRVVDYLEMDRKLLEGNLGEYSSVVLVYGTMTGASAIELHPVHYDRNIQDFVPNRERYYQKGFYMIKFRVDAESSE